MPLRSKLFIGDQGDQALEAALVSNPAHITRGAQGDHVAKIQQCVLIHETGINLGKELQTKTYGLLTAAAVKKYKANRDIINRAYQPAADDIVGIMTMQRMDKDMVEHERQTGPEFIDFTAVEMFRIDGDVTRSRQMLDIVLSRLRAVAATTPGGGLLVTPRNLTYYDTKLKVFRIFHINTFTADDFPVDVEIFASLVALYRGQPFPPPGDPSDGTLFSQLLANFVTVNQGMHTRFAKQFWPSGTFKGNPITFFSAFVGSSRDPDKTVHFTRRYFNVDEVDDDSRAVTLAHERAHTLLRIDGHPGTGDSPFCVAPHLGDPNVRTPQEALANAYCYEWLIYALQRDYNPGKHAGIECGTVR
jgi:hypothetical protein